VERLEQRLQIARKALQTLSALMGEEKTDLVRDAAIQRFEYSFEAVWKAAQRFLVDIEGTQAGSPKRVIRESRLVELLDEESARRSLAMTDDRNLTVHTYNEALADAIFERLPGYAQLMEDWLSSMEKRWVENLERREESNSPTAQSVEGESGTESEGLAADE
jgi:nucleotidyltransferase substrate binding protein (TIGR01987 family)